MILENGVVRTMDSSLPTTGALAIAGDHVAGGVGTHETALASPDVVDLGGRSVIPGLTDSHVHFPSWAVARRLIGLEDAASADDAAARAKAGLDGLADGRWLRAEGFREADWPAAPTSAALDAVTGEVPAALVSKDHHAIWLNSAAIAQAGGDLRAYDVPGGVVEVDEGGEPTGLLREESAWRFKEDHLEYSDAEYLEAMREGLKVAASRGVTAIHDKDGWLPSIPRLWQELERNDELRLRVWQSIPHEQLDGVAAAGVASGLGGALLRLGYLKVFMDGTLGSQTALMTDGTGVEITTREELADILRRSARARWPVAVHAIGDLANTNALDAFEETRDEWQPLGLRHRIEHAQCLRAEDVGRFAPLDLTASVQFSHSPSDEELAGRFWADRLDGTYSFRDLLTAGTRLINGSDAPIEDLDPWSGICAGVLGHWRADQRVTAEEALVAVTVGPAWQTYDERRRGKLLPGYLADLVVLDRDPLAIPPEELPEVQVVATMVGGRWTHNPPPW
ncbi:MAG: amidohydrolase [Verrucomicrobiota bacterium]